VSTNSFLTLFVTTTSINSLTLKPPYIYLQAQALDIECGFRLGLPSASPGRGNVMNVVRHQFCFHLQQSPKTAGKMRPGARTKWNRVKCEKS
jgi:hypothetical protein